MRNGSPSLTPPATERSARFTSPTRFIVGGISREESGATNTAVKFPACTLYVALPPLGGLWSPSRLIVPNPVSGVHRRNLAELCFPGIDYGEPEIPNRCIKAPNIVAATTPVAWPS